MQWLHCHDASHPARGSQKEERSRFQGFFELGPQIHEEKWPKPEAEDKNRSKATLELDTKVISFHSYVLNQRKLITEKL